MLNGSTWELVALDLKYLEFIDRYLDVMSVKIISMQLRIHSKLHHFLLILLLLERMIVLASEIFLIPLLNLNVFIYLCNWCILWRKCLSVPLRHRFFVIFEDLHSTRLWNLYDLQIICSILEQLLKFASKHFMINYDDNVDVELADGLCQTLSRPIVLRSKTIDDATTGKCLRVGRGNKTLQFFFIIIHKDCFFTCLGFVCGLDHVFLVEKGKIVFESGLYCLRKLDYLSVKKVKGLFCGCTSIEIA